MFGIFITIVLLVAAMVLWVMKFRIWSGVSVAVAFLIILTGSFISVGAGETGVVTQFGKVTGRELQPGLSIVTPFVQDVWIADTRIQKEQTDAEAASTDLQTVKATVAVNYHLDHGKVSSIYQNIGENYKDRVIDPAIQESIKATVSKFNAADLISNRQAVKDSADKVLADRLAPYGIIVDAVSIVNFDFSDDFNKAIEQKQVAQQQAEQAQYHLEQAQKDAQAQEAQKESLTPEILEQQAINKWDGKMPQYVGSGSVFNIPLTK